MFRTLVCVGILSCISNWGFAQKKKDSITVELLDEIVITDSRFKLKKENSGKVITRIDQNELKNLPGKSIAEIINATVGVEINGTKSSPAQNLGYFVRGGRNRQVLIMIDGIAITDPSQIANDYDLRLLNADQVESIEIMKGASSTLYGTGAATAVINIELKEAADEPYVVNMNSSIGTNQSQNHQDYELNNFMNSVSMNGTLNRFDYRASFGHQYTDGISAVEAGREDDAFNSQNTYIKLGYRFSDHLKISTYANFDKFKADFDDGFSLSDANFQSKSKQKRWGISSVFDYKGGNITFNAAYNDLNREVSSDFPAIYNSNSMVADVYNRYVINEKFFTVLGLNAQKNEMESFSIPFEETEFSQDIDPEKASFTLVDPYLNAVYISDIGLNMNAGIRLNNHSEYGNHLVYNLNPSYLYETSFGYLKGLASYSTSFITPSLYQLFEPNYGNRNLSPEKSSTFEIGAEVNIHNKLNLNLIYYNRNEKNFIDFVDRGNFVYQYQNVEEEFTASGFEVVGNYKFSDQIKLNFNATYTGVDKDLNLRIPEIKANAALDYKISNATFIRLNYQYNDDRKDSVYNNQTFENEAVNLKSYSIFDFYFNQMIIRDKMDLFLNVTNILNEDFNEIYGYATRGRNIQMGFKLDL